MANDPTPTQPLSIPQWASRLKGSIVPSDLDDAVFRSLLNHLTDLKVMIPCGEDKWKLSVPAEGQSTELVLTALKGRLEALSQTEAGFAVGYFLLRPSVQPLPIPSDSAAQAIPSKPMPERASDLSNLQIVKKVGRQLKPYLDQEKVVLDRLQGPYTSKEDAQRLFHFVFSQKQEKASPRKWEQLSRRRHK